MGLMRGEKSESRKRDILVNIKNFLALGITRFIKGLEMEIEGN